VSRNALSFANKVLIVSFSAIAGIAILASCTKENLSTAPTEPHVANVEGATSSLTDAAALRGRDFTESALDNERFAIRLERKPCYGLCPVYVIEIGESGLVRYNGTQYVKQHGEVTKQLSSADMDRLKKAFERAGFLSLSWKDPCPEMWTDNATVITTLVSSGRKRTIEHYHGNKCFPEKLSELEKTIDDVVGSGVWTKCPRPDGYDACEK
jgi:hypothetical protein